jgi:lysozyme
VLAALAALVAVLSFWSSEPMKMTAIGRAALQGREGTKLVAYKDSVGVWTIGTGHTAACGAPIPRAGLKITSAEADACLERDLGRFERAIASALKVPVSENEFDALVSIAFNVGPGFANSTAVRKLNAGDRAGAAKAIMMWSKPASIIDRREGERDQFLTPYAKAMPKARRSDARPVKAPARLILPPIPPDVPAPPVAAPRPAPKAGFFTRVAALFRKV